MSKLSNLADGLIDLADKFAPLLAGTPAGPIILAGKTLLDLFDKAKSVVDEKDQGRLSARRDQLEPLVLAHLDKTIGSLG